MRSLLRLLTCTAVVSIMLFATADSMAGKKKRCRPVQVNRCPPVSCVVPGDQVCPLYEWANWGNGVSSYYAMFNVNVDCMSTNPRPDASYPVNLNAASGIPPTDGLCDDECIDASNLLRNRTPRPGRGRNAVKAGTSARTKINRIPNDQHLYNHHVDQKKYTAQILRPMGSPRGELVRFQGLTETVYAQLLIVRVRENANSTAAGPWHIIPVAVEIDGNNNTHDEISVDVAGPHLAYYDAGTVEFQIVTKTRLK